MNKKRIMNQVHYPLFIVSLVIPVQLEDARFRKSERFITKAHLFIKGYSLKKKCNAGYDLLSLPKGWFRNALCGVIDFENTLHGCSLLDNAGAYYPEHHSLQSMPFLKALLIPAESCIFK